MFKTLKILTLLQLSEKIKLKRETTFSQKLGIVGKSFFHTVISYVVLVLLCFLLFNILFVRKSVLLLTFVLFIMQLLSIVTSTVSMTDSLYLSKDNYLLMTYPVKHSHIYISKLLVAYILELRRGVQFTLPLLLAYATINTNLLTFNYVLASIIYSVLLPLFPVLIGALLSIPVALGKKFIKKYTIIQIFGTIALFVSLFLITQGIINALPENFSVVRNYDDFLDGLDTFYMSVNRFSTYVGCLGELLYGKNIFINNLLIIAILIVIGVVSIASSVFVYFKIASSASESSIQKNHSSKNKAHKSTFLTFMRKEMTLSIRNIGNFASDYFFLFILPFVLMIVSSIYVRVDRDLLGECMTYGFIGMIALIMLSASNTASATAISSEGTEFCLIKTAPGKTSNIVWSKILINFLTSTIFLALTFALLSYTLDGYVELSKLWLVFVYVILIDLGLILWSIQLDILNPKLKEFANSQNKSEIQNFAHSITIGCIASIIFSAALIVLYLINFSIAVLAAILVGIGIVFVLFRLYFLINYMNAYFDDIQL